LSVKWFAGAAVCVLSPGPAALAQSQSAPTPASSPAPAVGASRTVEGVTVTAVRPKEQILLDRRVYSITTDLQATTGVAADILNQIPSVDVDADGNVSLRGDPNVTILVDGKPSAQFSGASRGLALQQFPAQDIDRIEVMTNPPAQYKAEGSAGVINIITRKTRRAGLSGTADLSVGDKRRFVAALSGAYNAGKLKLNGSFTLRQDDKERQVSDHRTAVDPTSPAGVLVKSQETIDEHFIRLTPQVKLGADYDISDRQTLGVSLSHREQTGKRFFLQNDQSGPVAGPPDSVTDRRSNGYEWNIDEGESVHFDQKLSPTGELLSLAYQRSVYRERERYAYVNDAFLPVGPPTQDRLRLSNDLIKQEVSADYALPMSHGRSLQLGYDFEDDRNRFDNVGDNVDPLTGALIDNPNVTNHFRYHQQVHAGYAQYEAPFGPWTLQTGVRVEQTNVHFLLITGNMPGGQSYFRAYPSLNLERKLGDDAKLTLSVSRRVTRPDPEALNPFTDFQDTHNLRAGNANLLPQDTWAYEVGYTGAVRTVNYGATAYYQFNRDSFTVVTEPIAADVTLTRQENLPKSKAAGLDFNVSGKLWSRLSYAASGNLFYSQISATSLGVVGTGGLRDTLGLNAKASLDWKPTSADTAQISFSRTDKRLTPQGSIGAINLVNLGYRRKLWGNLSAVATVTDLFDGQRFQRIVTTPTLQDNYNRHVFGRIAYLGLSYTFGGTRKAKQTNFEYDPGG
jgi:outer membrane receptor protein involved in Fe transport